MSRQITHGRLRARIVLLGLLASAGCRDLTLPPVPSHADEILRACQASAIHEYTDARQEAGSADDAARIACKLAERLDQTSDLATTAATVCAHALGAYTPPFPRTASAAMVGDGHGSGVSGQATCVQSRASCGFALFVRQSHGTSSSLELLGPSGCNTSPDPTRGVLFACCVQPAAPLPPPGPVGAGTTTTPGG
jgi:hypothetical protein